MSNNELNKGRMIPVEESIESVAEKCVTELDTSIYNTKVDQFKDERWEYGYDFLNGKLYKMEFDIEAESALDFVEVSKDKDGVIKFFTIHYNGGASLMEVIEEALLTKAVTDGSEKT